MSGFSGKVSYETVKFNEPLNQKITNNVFFKKKKKEVKKEKVKAKIINCAFCTDICFG